MITWDGDARFARAMAHGCDLRAGLLFDRLIYGWLVYDAATMERIAWGERTSMAAAQVQAEAIAEALGPGSAAKAASSPSSARRPASSASSRQVADGRRVA